jgi:glycosyltransferase involved in cell wall biosynthesis
MKQGYTYFIGTSWSGAIPDHFKALAKELASRGHRVILLVDGQRKDVVDEASNPGVLTWPSRRPTRLRDALFLAGLVRRYRPQCVIGNFGSVNVMMMVGWLMRIPVRVAYYHTLSSATNMMDRRHHWLRLLFHHRKSMVYRLCTHMTPVSLAAREDLIRSHDVPPSKITILRNSLRDPLRRLNISQKDRAGYAVCAGCIERWKGQDVLIRAIALLDEPLRPCVYFLGSGSMQAECERLAKELGVSPQMHFLGRVPHSEVLQCMSGGRLTIVPSRSDNLPTVIIESLAVGTPVVAAAVGGIPEMIDDGIHGFLVPPEDPYSLAERINVLLSCDDMWQVMSAKARERFLDRYEQSRVVTEQANWFERIVAEAVQRG